MKNLNNLNILYRETPVNSVSQDGLVRDGVFELQADESEAQCLAVLKKTQYQTHPADLMLISMSGDESQLSQVNSINGRSFLHTAAIVASVMQGQLGYGIPVVAINQQHECIYIPYKFLPDGTEVKVQTLNQLHAHVFVEDGSGRPYCTLTTLEHEARNDFYDPYAYAMNKPLLSLMSDTMRKYSLKHNAEIMSESFPLGPTIQMQGVLEEVLATNKLYFAVRDVQQNAVKMYYHIRDIFLAETGRIKDLNMRRKEMLDFLLNLNVDKRARRIMMSLASNIKPGLSEEPMKSKRLVQGPAFTWLFYEKGGDTYINFTPRVVSRGNAMESFGIWIEQDKSRTCHFSEVASFYQAMLPVLNMKVRSKEGHLISTLGIQIPRL